MSEFHVLLLVKYIDGKPYKESVHVRAGESQSGLVVIYSPGYVEGVAAGDEIRIINEDGSFEIIRRGGNLSIQIYSKVPVEPFRADICTRLESIGARLDGSIKHGLVFTVHVDVGFSVVQKVMEKIMMLHNEVEWAYGNVYDPRDGVTPLDWWKKR